MKEALGRHPEYGAAHKILFQFLILFLTLTKFTTLNIPQKLHLDLKHNSVQCIFFFNVLVWSEAMKQRSSTATDFIHFAPCSMSILARFLLVVKDYQPEIT